MSSISGIYSREAAAYTSYAAVSTKAVSTKDTDTDTTEDVAAVYEKSTDSEDTTSTKKTYTQNTAVVNQLKADAEARNQQMQAIVEQMLTGQGKSYALASEDEIWKMFADGDFSNVSEAAIAQAKEDIADGGYYSVEETASRILDFAKALTGGDPDQIDSMLEAFKQGYSEATKSWGQDLPEISSKTYDAVLEGFESWRKESSEEAE